MTDGCAGCRRAAEYVFAAVAQEPESPLAMLILVIDANGSVHNQQVGRRDTPWIGPIIEAAGTAAFDVVCEAMRAHGYVSPTDA